MATYDLSSLALLENEVYKMISDQQSGAFNFVGGNKFTATYGNTGISTNPSETTAGISNRLQKLIINFDQLPR